MNAEARRLGLDSLITFVMAGLSIVALVGSGALTVRWAVFVLTVTIGLATTAMVPPSRRYQVFLVFFFFAIPIGMEKNFFSLSQEMLAYHPVTGIRIRLAYVPFFFLFLGWLLRLVMLPHESVNFVPWISVPFLLICGWVLAGLAMSDQPGVITFWSVWEAFQCWLIFLYLANNLTDRRSILLAVGTIMVTVLIQFSVGLMQWATGGHEVLGQVFGEGVHFSEQQLAGQFAISRVGGTVGHPNRLAAYLGLILPSCLSMLFAPISPRWKGLVAIVLTLGIILITMTYSRGGWLGFGLGVPITIYFCLVRRIRQRFAAFILMVGLTVTLIITTLILVPSIKARLFEHDYGAAKARVPMSILASNMIADNPWFGVGLGNYTNVSTFYDITPEAISYTFNHPVHNEFLLIASEIGLPALGLFIFIFLVIFTQLYRLGRSREDPVMPYLAFGLFGGFLAWIIHHQFEYHHAVISVQMWAFVGLVMAMRHYDLKLKPAVAPSIEVTEPVPAVGWPALKPVLAPTPKPLPKPSPMPAPVPVPRLIPGMVLRMIPEVVPRLVPQPVHLLVPVRQMESRP